MCQAMKFWIIYVLSFFTVGDVLLLISACVCSVLHLAPREDEVFYDVVAVVDPLTREAQKLAPLLIVSAHRVCVCECF